MAQPNEAVVRRLFKDFFGTGNAAVVPEIVAETFVGHHPLMPLDRGALIGMIMTLRSSFSGLASDVREVVVSGPSVGVHWVATGTFERDLTLGPAVWKATGKTVSVRGVDIFRVSDEKIVEATVVSDLDAILGPPTG